jgi:hypothetical protein
VRYDLSALVRRTRNPRRSIIVLREITAPAVMATDLFRAVYLPVIQVWERGAAPILAEYERTLSTLTIDGADVRNHRTTLDAPADVSREIGFVEQEVSRLILTLTPRLRDWTLRVERHVRGKWRGAVLSATGVDLTTLIGPEDARQTMEAAASWNASLVKDVSEQARQRISNAVFAGLNERKPAREVAREIREATGMARRRSVNIASDQLSKLSNSLSDERRREAGISIWEWVHSRKLHPRESHKARDGNLYSDDPAMVGKVISGKTVRTPPATRPGQEPFCGCRQRSVIFFGDD